MLARNIACKILSFVDLCKMNVVLKFVCGDILFEHACRFLQFSLLLYVLASMNARDGLGNEF